MANHLTPEELSKELGLDRQEVIRVCVRGGRADLPGEDRQVPLPGAAAGDRRDAAASTERQADSAVRRLLRAWRLARPGAALSRRLSRSSEPFAAPRGPAPRRRSGGAPPSGRSPASRRPARARRSPGRQASPRASARGRGGTRSRSPPAPTRPTRLAITWPGELQLGLAHLGRRRRPPRSPPSSGRPRRRRASRARARRPGRGSGRGSPCPRARTSRPRPCPTPPSRAAGGRTGGAAPRRRPARGSTCGRRRRDRRPRAGRSGGSRSTGSAWSATASRSDSSTSTYWPFANSQPLTSSSASTSRSWTGHQRFCLIGVPHSRWRVRNDTSCRWVASASPMGMLTRPKLMDPFQIVRMRNQFTEF